MIPKFLNEMWTAPDRVGRSFVAVDAIRRRSRTVDFDSAKKHVRARYWLWLATSVKFLIPFSLPVVLGSQLSWSPASARTNASLYVAMEQVSQPFRQSTMPMPTEVLPSTVSSSLVHGSSLIAPDRDE
jgi:hypothetical protein